MKLKRAILLLASVLTFPVWAIEAVISASPSRPVAGEIFTLELTVNSMEQFSWHRPVVAGLKISRNFTSTSSRHTIVNGKSTVSTVYGLNVMAEKPGRLTIPALTLDFNGRKVKTNTLQLLVRDPASLPDAEKFSAILNILPERKVYVGETLRADLELFVPSPWQLQRLNSITAENFAGGIFFNSKNGNFFQTSPIHRRNGGIAAEFSAIFQVHESGEFTPECRIIMQVSKGGSDFFFGPPPENRQITAVSARKLQVLPLPPVPDGAVNTGLVGKWQIVANVSKNKFKAGDIAEVTLTFTGENPTQTFRAPELTFPGARVYPAEVKKSDSARVFTVKYPFVAVKSGDYKLDLRLAVFDPSEGKYTIFTPGISYHVAVNPDLDTAPVVSNQQLANDDKTEVKPVKYTPLSLVKPGSPVKLPLYRNNLAGIVIALAIGVLSLAAAWIKQHDNKEKRALKKQLDHLAAEIKKADDPGEILRDGKVELLASAMGLPPGATVMDIAEKVDDPELKKYLQELGTSSFMPGSSGGKAGSTIRKKLLSLIRKVMVLAVLAGAFTLEASDFDRVENDFDNARYAEAMQGLRELSGNDPQSVDPALLYDAGSIDYMRGNYPEAFCSFTRAVMLSPQNPLYRRAAAMAAEKLPVKVEKTAAEYPGFLRPDQYWLIAALLFMLAGIMMLIRRNRALIIVLWALSVIFTACGFWQTAAAYSSERAIVVGKSGTLYSIPAFEGGKTASLPGGTMVMIREKKGDFYRVENSGISGWMKHDAVARIFPFRTL